jgi:myo-inositol-1(or 4)-monophosphatase
MNLGEDALYVVDLARSAGKLVLDHYGKVDRLVKRGDEAVSEADRASQRMLIAGLRKRFPGDGVIGEENETGDAITFEVPNPAGRNWVIDPIDGTNNFLAGLGIFAVCIGLLEAGRPTMGVVYDVVRDEMYAAQQGRGAWLGSRRLSVLNEPLGDHAMLMLTSNLETPARKLQPFATRWLSQTNWKIRILGSAALEAINVAAGVAHGAITLNGKLWDIVAPAAVVLESGGVVTDPSGKNVFPFDLKGYAGGKVPFLMAGPVPHAELLKEVAKL